jgi:hypothetical protein
MKKLYALFLIVVGSVMYRIRGGLVPAFPRPTDQILFALPFGAIAYKISNRNIWWFIGVLSLTTLSLTTGHGAFMDLGRVNYPVSPERLDFIVRWFFGPDNFHSFWRDGFGLAITGLAVTLPCAIALAIHKKYILSLILLLSGALKFPAYYIGWEVFSGTEGGEYLYGAFAWASAIWVYSRLPNP